MVRKLMEEDRASVLRYLSAEPSINLFIIGDIEAFGFDKDFQEVWGQFDSNDELEGVLLRFNVNFIPYFIKPDFDITEFKDIILSNEGNTMISGKESIVSRFIGILPDHIARLTFFCELANQGQLKIYNSDRPVMIAEESDAKRVHNLIEQIEEFNNMGNTLERLKYKLKTKTGRAYYIENEKGSIVSVAQTTAENSRSAMVVGVATSEEYRCRGYMSACLSRLCADVISEGKTLCLFYDNPKAGAVYHRLGFQTIDNWMMITKDE